jgi:hypothetical protein
MKNTLKMSEFYSKLAETRKVMDWDRDTNGCLRGRFKNNRNNPRSNRHYCPITAVARLMSGKYYEDGEVETANREVVRLESRHRTRVVQAADRFYVYNDLGSKVSEKLDEICLKGD